MAEYVLKLSNRVFEYYLHVYFFVSQTTNKRKQVLLVFLRIRVSRLYLVYCVFIISVVTANYVVYFQY